MSTVGPPSALPPIPGPVAPTPAASVTNLPPGLANLTAGAIINGVVTGRDNRGHTLVRTPNGNLTLATALALSTGSTLSLQVQTVGTQVQFVVLSVDEQPVAQGVERTDSAAPPPVEAVAGRGGAAQQQARPPVTVTIGTVLTATVAAAPGSATAAALSGVVAAAPGSAAATALSGAVPATPGSATPAPSGAVPATPGSAAAAPSGAADATAAAAPAGGPVGAPQGAATPAVPATPPDVGSRMSLRIVAIDADTSVGPQGLLRAATADRPNAPLIAATVATPDAAGQVRLQTPLGLLTLSTKALLPPSAHVVVELLGLVQPPEAAGFFGPVGAQGAQLTLDRDWPALTEALRALGRTDAGLAQNVIDNVIPRPGSGLAASILFLLSALRGGNIRGWLGEPMLQVLERAGHSNLVARLGEDFTQMSRLATEPATGDWRTWLIPIHDGLAPHLVRLFVKRPPRRNAEDDEHDAGTRFLVEADLSRLGPLQLDGLVKPKHFDLIVRSHAVLPRDVRRGISTIFHDALAATGFSGGIAFQATPTFAVAPIKEIGARTVGLSV
ncbi:MAG: hypothetical protein V3U18_04820 [Alphaproteobacteria bacterium]